MDRNVFLTLTVRNVPVALRKESVDRNNYKEVLYMGVTVVALRKESVDRNRNSQYSYFLYYGVALRKESVDRNKYVVQCRKTLGGRSPQGERG